VPVALGVLAKYGEGPHDGVAFVPIALAFTWWALERRAPVGHRRAAIACGPWFRTTFTAPPRWRSLSILLGVFWITRQQKRSSSPPAAIPILAYGLTASGWCLVLKDHGRRI